ncbi:MAG: hypothetical protein MUO76_12880 [Anaerolineaceae bacterium]|nr:hypothetical protein [Anaerolineaceae bacterium]
MTESINWSLNAQIVGGPKIMASDTKEIEAYDKIEVTIENDAIDKEVEIQPGGIDKVQFLVIRSEKYSEELTYKVNNPSSTDIIKLDALHVFIGTGAVGLLKEPPEKLLFTNGLPDSVSVEILVGRMATSPL